MEVKENEKGNLEKQYKVLIKSKEKKEEKYFIIVLVIIFVTLIATIISVVFAYKAYSSSKKLETIKKGKSYYEVLTTTYNDGNKLVLNNIGNGYKLNSPKIIELSNEGNKDLKYNIVLGNIKTSLLSTNNLVYTITESGDITKERELPLTRHNILTNITIKPKEKKQYIINAYYKGTMEENNYSNYYNADIIVEQINNQITLLE